MSNVVFKNVKKKLSVLWENELQNLLGMNNMNMNTLLLILWTSLGTLLGVLPLKVNQRTKLNIFNQFHNQNLRQIGIEVHNLKSDILTNNKTDRQREITTIRPFKWDLRAKIKPVSISLNHLTLADYYAFNHYLIFSHWISRLSPILN